MSLSSSLPTDVRRTPLNALHRQLGGKIVPFAGWEMPVEYSGIIAEHLAVRHRAGLFDVSHMGEIMVSGPRALELVQHVTSNDASRLKLGQAQYSGLMTAEGTFVDDLLVHKLGESEYLLVVNAANLDADLEHLRVHNPMRAEVHDLSSRYAQIALQGPLALELLKPFSPVPLSTIPYYWFVRDRFLGVEALIARTGYTGEDGFEIYLDPGHAEMAWNALLEAGGPRGLLPCGLGARNTLRLEAAMALYGHEINRATTPWEAGLGWICKLDKTEFLGRDRLAQLRAQPLARKLAGLEMIEPGIARDGYPVFHDDRQVGVVTSGAPAPFLQRNIALAYLPPALAVPGVEVEVAIRNRRSRARVVRLPFYHRARKA